MAEVIFPGVSFVFDTDSRSLGVRYGLAVEVQ